MDVIEIIETNIDTIELSPNARLGKVKKRVVQHMVDNLSHEVN